MKMDDIMAAMEVPENADDLDQLTELLLCAEDVEDSERAAFICGYLAGVGFAIANDNSLDIAAVMSARMMEWQLRGWI